MALLLGTLFSPAAALKLGLVDEIVDDIDDQRTVVHAAIKKAAEFVQIPAMARVAGKKVTRGKQIDSLLVNRKEDTHSFCSYIEQPSVQKAVGAYVERLTKRKKGN